MTLDDKVDLILDKLNGSEGSVLRTDIQVWLPEGHSNPVDNQLIIDTLLKKKLIRSKHSTLPDTFIINAKGRRINDKGGWKKYLKRTRRDQVIKEVITYSNIGFAAINIIVLVYSFGQSNRIESEVDRLRIDLERQHKIRNDNGRRIDSLEKVVRLQLEKTIMTDSSIQTKRIIK
jgi:hypothetical protein